MAKVRGDQQRVESLQRLLASSWSAKLLAVRKVAQENDGRKTPGIDGVVSTTAEDRVSLLKDGLRLQGYRPLPVRREGCVRANTGFARSKRENHLRQQGRTCAQSGLKPGAPGRRPGPSRQPRRRRPSGPGRGPRPRP